MSRPQLTEERLRNYLDGQFSRESLCTAILPLLGPYKQVKPRRPKGGPDGGRDLEAVFSDEYVTWGAVGFRNGGGNDREAREDARKKFEKDLARMLKQNAGLSHFVFFTNVDLTPSMIEAFVEHAKTKGIVHAEVFDLNRLRVELDSPAGMIARLQYLDIEMTKTDQLALVNRFGDELQNAFAERLDRVDETLFRLERFVDFQKPIRKRTSIFDLKSKLSSIQLGLGAALMRIQGLCPSNPNEWLSILIANQIDENGSDDHLTVISYYWTDKGSKNDSEKNVGAKSRILPSDKTLGSLGASARYITSSAPFGIMTLSSVVGVVAIEAMATRDLAPEIKKARLIVNGYEIFSESITQIESCHKPVALATNIELPPDLAFLANPDQWVSVVPLTRRNIIANPPVKADYDLNTDDETKPN